MSSLCSHGSLTLHLARAACVGWGLTALLCVLCSGAQLHLAAGLTLYFLDLVYRLAQWMNTSAVTGSLVSENLLTLDLKFDSVSAQLTCMQGVPDVQLATVLAAPMLWYLHWHAAALAS